jgi:Glycosyltransferase family 87
MSDTPRLRRWLVATALLWMALINVVILWNTRVQIRQGYGDFASFYTAGTLVRRGLGAELYNPAAQWRVQQEFAAEVKTRRGPLPYIRPPFEALLFCLFTAWPYATALLLWTGFKLVLLAAIPLVVIRTSRWTEPFPRWTVGLLILGTFPEFMDLLMGQDAVLLTFLFTIAFWQLERGRDLGAGVTLGLALFKFQLVLPFVLILWIAGRKSVLRGIATSGAVVVAISAVMVGWKGLLQYPAYLLALNREEGAGMIWPEQQINLRGLLTLFVGRSPYPGHIHWLLAPVGAAAIVYAGLTWRKVGDRLLAEGFGLALIITIVTSYYAYDYDLLLLAVPLLVMWTRPAADVPQVDNVTRYCEAAGLLLLLLTPVYWLAKAELHTEYLMTLPLLALGVAWARRLCHADLAALRTPLPDGPA